VLDQETDTEQLLAAKKNDLRSSFTETQQSQTATDKQTDNKVLLRKKRTTSASRRKKSTRGRVPHSAVVCVPCKKHFACRSMLDQHSRLVHDVEVVYDDDECHEVFSHRDNIAGRVKPGKCMVHSQQPIADAELSVIGDDGSQHLSEPGMFIVQYPFNYLLIAGPPNGPVLFCTLSSVGVVCRRLYLGWTVGRRRVGHGPAAADTA